jgi:hypothetical protein
MPTEITIKKVNGVVEFAPVSVALSETVFWRNEDTTEPHWPNYQNLPMTRTQIGKAPSTNSDSWPLPQTASLVPVVYQCSLHPGESGTITIYANLAATNTTLTPGTAGQAYGSQALTAGGLAPFTWSVAPAVGLGGGVVYGVPPGLSLSQTPNPSAAVAIGGTPSAAGSYLFTLAVTDSAGNNFQQQNYTVVIA